ncbi:unnamed protein product [Cochlearia groenlandica]
MGSEGCGGVRVSSNKTGNNFENEIYINACVYLPFYFDTGAGTSSGTSDSSLWRKLMHSHDFVHDRLTKLRVESSSEPQNGYSTVPSPESANSSRKRGKLSRSSSNGTSKKTKLILSDDTVRENDTKEICGQGSTHFVYSVECYVDKSLAVKQRSSFNGRRSEKRNSKVPTRTFSTVSSATGEDAYFGAYGLKPEINDVTNLLEDLALNKLLEGSYECPSLGKAKKKLENTNKSLLSVVRNVWSILPTKKHVQSQSSAELDITLGSPSSISATLNGENNDTVNTLDCDLSSSSKDNCINPEIDSTPLNFPLCKASDVLKRLGLPAPKDLDSLLQDASKPSQNTKINSDQQRAAKQVPPRSGLPHFPWSQAFNGSSRTNSDAAKLLSGKTLCQGRWLKIADTIMRTSSPESRTDHFTNLDSLIFNQNLVPPIQRQTITGTKASQTILGNTTSCQCWEASVSTFQKASVVPTAISCPHLLEAAQTLCDFTTQSGNHNNPNEILRWPKKLSQKSMKARKSILIEKPPERHATPISFFDLKSSSSSSNNKNNNHLRKDSAAEHNHHHHHLHHNHLPKPSKRMKLSTMVNKKGTFPSSSSSPAIESDRKHSSSSKFKNQSRMMLPPPPQPPTRPLHRSSTYPHKARKFP